MQGKGFLYGNKTARKLVATILAVLMLFNSAVPVIALANSHAIDDEIVVEVDYPETDDDSDDVYENDEEDSDLLVPSVVIGEGYLFTINIVEFTNPPGGFTLVDLTTNEPIEGVVFARGPNNWWQASFRSPNPRLDLRIDGLNSWQTAFDRSFVLTPEFSTAYLFSYDMASIVYTNVQPDGRIDFTVVAWEDLVTFAGTFNGWSADSLRATVDDTGMLLALLTPYGADFNANRRVHTASINGGFGTHEFKMLRNGNWAHGANAGINVSAPFSISLTGPATLVGAGEHLFEAVVAPAPTGNLVWRIVPEIDGISIENGTVTVSEDVETGTEFSVVVSYGDVSASRDVRFFTTAPDTVTLTINYFQHAPQNYNRWNLWLWRILPTGLPGMGSFDFEDRVIDGNLWRTVEIEVPRDSQRFGMIVRLGNWERQNPQVHFDMNFDEDGYAVDTEIFYVDGERRYHRELPVLGAGVLSAMGDWHNYIRMTMNFIPDNFDPSDVRLYDVTDAEPVEIPVLGARRDVGRGLGGSEITIFHVDLENYALAANRHYQLLYGTQPLNQAADVVMRSILDRYYHANNRTEPLGATWSPNRTDFRLWTPVATNVELALYHGLDQRMHPNPSAGQGDLNLNGHIHQERLRNPEERIPMVRNDETGVWSLSLDRALAGYFYMFRVTFADGSVEYAIDPYATATTANGNLGAIITDDPVTGRGAPLRNPATGRNNLNPNGPNYQPIRRDPSRPLLGSYQVDHIIYELHIRDFSIHPSSGINYDYRGGYLAFTERGTTVNGVEGAPSTGLDHLIELGVTTVHLLPMYLQATINELGDLSFEDDTYDTVSGVSRAMNWGYDPKVFNTPEGSFSTDPRDPAVRIREMKAMINAMHEQGMRVVKDVVYNHTYSIIDGPFQRSVPNYFHRSWCNGLFSDGAGVGNEIASERPMVRQYIIDSLLFWQSEFGIDGFRFDLMWLHDTATMYEAVRQLRAVDPDVLIYGEPWRASASPLDHSNLFSDYLHDIARSLGEPRGVRPTYHATVSGQGFGVFNDMARNANRGGNDNNSRGFISGASSWEGNRIEPLIWRNIRSDFSFTHWASEGINYVSKHDNLILFDNVSWSLGSVWGGIDAPGMTNDTTNNEPHDQINNWDFHRDPFAHINRESPMSSNPVRALTLGTGLVLTSQGVPFLHAGDEFIRTKHGHRNTYNSPDFYNALRWYQKEEFIDVHNYFAGLIQLRRERPAFRMNARWGMDDFYHLITASAANPHVVAYRLGEHAGGDSWRNIYVAMNGSAQTRSVNLGNDMVLNVVVDATHVGRHPETGALQSFREIGIGEYVELPPFSMLVAFDIDEAVESELTGLTLNPGILSINADETRLQPLMPRFVDQLGNTYRGDVADFEFIWHSTNETIATVSQNGIVSGVAAGTTEIVLKATNGDVTLIATAEIRVAMQRYLVVLYDGPAGADLWTWELDGGAGGRAFPFNESFGNHDQVAIIPITTPDIRQVGIISRRNGTWDSGRDFADNFHPVITLSENDIYTVVRIPYFDTTDNQTNRYLIEQYNDGITTLENYQNTYFIHLRYRSQSVLAGDNVRARINDETVTLLWNEEAQYFEYIFTTSSIPQTVYNYEFSINHEEWQNDRFNPSSSFTIPGESSGGGNNGGGNGGGTPDPGPGDGDDDEEEYCDETFYDRESDGMTPELTPNPPGGGTTGGGGNQGGTPGTTTPDTTTPDETAPDIVDEDDAYEYEDVTLESVDPENIAPPMLPQTSASSGSSPLATTIIAISSIVLSTTIIAVKAESSLKNLKFRFLK